MVSSLVTFSNHLDFDYTMDEAFPEIDPLQEPLGSLALVQIRRPKMVSRGGIIINDETRSTEYYNTQVAKVIALGPLCFKNRNTMENWPEGAWCAIGEFVYVPKHGGVRFSIKHPFKYPLPSGDTKTEQEEVIFMHVKDVALIGRITGDPLKIRAFLD